MDAVNTDGLMEELRALANRLYGDGDEYDAYRPIMEAIDRLAAVEAELAALRADAERYRWLRAPENTEAVEDLIGVFDYGDSANFKFDGNELDAAIDAARLLPDSGEVQPPHDDGEGNG